MAAMQDNPDAQFKIAVRSFQRFAGLRVTGESHPGTARKVYKLPTNHPGIAGRRASESMTRDVGCSLGSVSTLTSRHAMYTVTADQYG